jgi:chromosome segregation ATPase
MLLAIIVCACLAILAFVASLGYGRRMERSAAFVEIAKKGRDQPPGANSAESIRWRETLANRKLIDAQFVMRQTLQQTVIKAESAKQTPSAETAQAEPPTVEPVMPDDVHSLPAASSEALTSALRLVAEQRKAAEALLLEVSVLEERLKSEANAAQAADEYAAAKAQVEAVTTLEQQTKALVQASSEYRAALAAKLREAEALVVETRPDAEAATAQVAALEQQLGVARKLAAQLLSLVERHEANAKQCSAELTAAEHEAEEAAARTVVWQDARATAEKAAADAGQRAEALKQDLPGAAQPFAGMSDVQALAGRIAEQASMLTSVVNASLSLLKPEASTAQTLTNS